MNIEKIKEKIDGVASAFHDWPVFQERARIAAQELGPECIDFMPGQFHGSATPPPELKSEFPGYGDWMSARQFAIFEILYHFGEASLPLLRQVGFGQYDWTQANAIRILCRLGVNGFQREQISEEVAEAFPTWREETIYNSIHALSHLAKYSPSLLAQLDTFVKHLATYDSVDALDILGPLAKYNSEYVREHEKMLREIMDEHGMGIRDPLLDGQVVEERGENGEVIMTAKSGPEHPSIPDYHAIRAALILLGLFPDDQETLKKVEWWQQNHPDKNVRKALAECLPGKQGR